MCILAREWQATIYVIKAWKKVETIMVPEKNGPSNLFVLCVERKEIYYSSASS